jgi:DNA-binding response OmpR family regulator
VTTVLVIDDEAPIRLLCKVNLEAEGMNVLEAADGTTGLAVSRTDPPDVVLLDVMMPGLDGLAVLRRLRDAGQRVPVIMLTARGDEADRVVGLELGADDYVAKPFSPREVAARVKAILRRASESSTPAEATVLEVGDVEVDVARREARVAGVPVALATREFDLLAFLARNAGIALSRQQLLDGVWGPDWYGDDRTVDVHVRQLRKKLGDALPLTTVWGVGYRLG